MTITKATSPTSASLLFALFCKMTKRDLAFEDFVVSSPQAIADGQHNTKVTITSKLITGYYCNHLFKYNRLHIAEFGPLNISRGSATRVKDLLPQLNDVGNFSVVMTYINDQDEPFYVDYGIFESDIRDAPLPVFDQEESLPMVIRTNWYSHLFYGTLQLNLFNN